MIKRIRCLFVVTLIALLSPIAMADRHLEAGGYLSSNTVLDDSFAFFTQHKMVLNQWGVDLRAEVLDVKDTLHLLPLISYRYATSDGSPYIGGSEMGTTLNAHEVDAGLRGRVWFLPWMGGFAQLQTGITHVQMKGEIDNHGQTGMYNRYSGNTNEWNLGATMGVEFRISPWQMERMGIKRFNFGGEIGVGFVKRTAANFTPTLEGGDDLSLPSVQTVDFGNLDLTGVVFQLGMTISFL
ncbi:MAG: hypothetical protein JXX14_26355 [Deltaproteobacteria bacterium]|nr:hypothetical protein [Deltaproteobacteria bacterium]